MRLLKHSSFLAVSLSHFIVDVFNGQIGILLAVLSGPLALAAVTPGYWPLLFLVVGSLGSAAFHPPGAMKASQMGNLHMAGQAATAASIFFLFGQSGLSLGPA